VGDTKINREQRREGEHSVIEAAESIDKVKRSGAREEGGGALLSQGGNGSRPEKRQLLYLREEVVRRTHRCESSGQLY